jgi:uncharacterized membrane protein YhdT
MTSQSGSIRRFLRRHCSSVTMARIVDPILTDIHIEADAADAQGHQWASRRIRAAGSIVLLKAITLYSWTRFWSIQEWSREDRRALARTLTYAATLTAAAIPLMTLPALIQLPANRWLYLVPEVLPIALPFCLFIGLIYAFRARMVSLRPHAAVLIAAVLCSIVSFATLTWVVPASNNASRVTALMDVGIQRGLPVEEVQSLIEGNRRFDREQKQRPINYHTRWALAAAPVVLAMWAFLVVARLPNTGSRQWPEHGCRTLPLRLHSSCSGSAEPATNLERRT